MTLTNLDIYFILISYVSSFYVSVTQPDLGTAILILISGIVLLGCGVRWKIFAYLSGLFIVLAPVAISFLKPYQKSRILTFLNPDRDPLGAGYQIIQSKIAIGSGGLFGKGFLNGLKAYLNFLPEKHTDFIFTLYSEEFGFVGSAFMIFLYFLITYRIIELEMNKKYFWKTYIAMVLLLLFLFMLQLICLWF